MKRYFILFVLFVILITDVVSQSHVRLNNYWNNGFSINPAAVNDSYQNSVTVATRKQWISFPGAPTDFYAAGTMYFEDYSMQLGAKVLTELKGYTQSTEIQLAYAYALSMSEDLILNMGIAGSYHNFAYDRSQITLASNEITSGIYENLLFKNSFDATLGFELAYKAVKLGLSSANVFALFNKENKLNPNTNIAYLFYKQYSSNPLNFGVGLSGFTYAGISQLELNGTMFYRRDSESNELQIGLFYRTKFELGAIAGIDFGKLKVSYSFDYNLGQVLNQSYGTHEIMLTYNFKPSRVCKSCRWY